MEDNVVFFTPYTLPASSYDTMIAVFLIICFSIILFVAFRYGNVMERLVGDGSSSIITPLATLPAQTIGQVFNPFAISLVNEHRASLTDGVTLNLTAKNPAWIGVYWGSKITDVYPIIYRQWKELRESDRTSAMLNNISLHHEQLQFHDAVTNKAVVLQPPPGFTLGPPPRDRYPLLLLLLDSIACEMSDEETQSCQHIVCMVILIHLKDALCPADSHIFSHFVRTAHGKPYDMKQLYVSRTDELPVQSPSMSTDGTTPVASNTAENDGVDANSMSYLCTVCQAAPIERALLPCRHTCVCTGCCAVLINCPMCRAFITSSFLFTPDSPETRTQ